MPAPAQLQTAAAVEPAAISEARLRFYHTRDDMVRAYTPATEEERLLVTQIAHAWIALQDANDMRAELAEAGGLIRMFKEDLDRYKMLARTVNDAERIWRYAIQEFHRAVRRREHTTPGNPVTRTNRSRPAPPPTPITVRPPESECPARCDPPTPIHDSQAPPGS